MVQQVEMAGAGMGADEQSLKPLLSTGEAASGVPLAAAETDSFSDKEQWRICDSSSNGSTRRWLVGVGIVFLFLAGLVLLLVVVQQGQSSKNRAFYNGYNLYADDNVVEIDTRGTLIENLPGANMLEGEPVANDDKRELKVRIRAAVMEAVVDDNVMIHMTSSVYQKDGASEDELYLFGPTMRVRAGDEYSVYLSNDLVAKMASSDVQHHVGDTNFHTHGLHASTGKFNQDVDDMTTNGDNIFLSLGGKKDSLDRANALKLTSRIPTDHLPGIHWYHPHRHGSTSIQTYSAAGIIIVEDDSRWLPEDQGCKDVWDVIASAKDRILVISLLTLGPRYSGHFSEWYDANYQLMSWEGGSDFCCDKDDKDSYKALYGSGSNLDLGFVNGAWKPTVRLEAGEWQRWRFAFVGLKRYTTLEVIDNETDQVVEDCEMQLLAKDGVYLMNIPRQIDYILLPSGGRSEVLIRCASATASKRYRLAAGRQPTPYSYSDDGMNWEIEQVCNFSSMHHPGSSQHHHGPGGGGGGGPGGCMMSPIFEQKTLAYIEVVKGETGSNEHLKKTLTPKKCTPLRPDYASDLRDANLAKFDAENKVVFDSRATFRNSPQGCTIGGDKFSFPDPSPLQAPIGSIVEWSWFMLWAHPLHLHTNPFQIMSLPPSGPKGHRRYTNYFEEGDWHDSLFLPMIRGVSIPVRFQPGPFFGYSVVHCHFLQHEDAGCMKVVEWTCPAGTKGNTNTGECDNAADAMPVKGTQ